VRILLLTRGFTRNGGIGCYVQDLTALLQAAGHQVAVICSEGGSKAGAARVEQVAGFDEFENTGARMSRERVLALAAEFDPEAILIHAMDDFDLERLLREKYAVGRFVRERPATSPLHGIGMRS